MLSATWAVRPPREGALAKDGRRPLSGLARHGAYRFGAEMGENVLENADVAESLHPTNSPVYNGCIVVRRLRRRGMPATSVVGTSESE